MTTIAHPKWQALAESAAPRRGLVWYLAWGALIALLAASWRGADMRPLDLLRDGGNMAAYAAEFFPPNFSQWKLYVSEMVVTLQIAVWGTALAVITAIPLSLLASSNIVPWWVNQPVRRLLDSFRAINEMVFAMLFVVAVGLGPFAGVLALWIHTAGTLAKLFSEAVESIDPQPVEGIRSTGAGALHEIVYGVIPQVMPLWTSYTLYRFEASALGLGGGHGGRRWHWRGAVGNYSRLPVRRNLRGDDHHRAHREPDRHGLGPHSPTRGVRPA